MTLKHIGVLLELCSITRPDISFAVNKVSQYMKSPLQTHWKAVKRQFFTRLRNKICVVPKSTLKLRGCVEDQDSKHSTVDAITNNNSRAQGKRKSEFVETNLSFYSYGFVLLHNCLFAKTSSPTNSCAALKGPNTLQCSIMTADAGKLKHDQYWARPDS
ncbi:hypothetical protein ACS0TY_029174 [Phlomoides rotata]